MLFTSRQTFRSAPSRLLGIFPQYPIHTRGPRNQRSTYKSALPGQPQIPSVRVGMTSHAGPAPVGGEGAAPELGTTGALQSDAGGPEAKADVVVQYVVLRRDLWAELGWPLGSVVAQACHASTAAIWISRDDGVVNRYCATDSLDSMHKVGDEQSPRVSGGRNRVSENVLQPFTEWQVQ